MTDRPVSVALCTHNSVRFITPQLTSIFSQTAPPLEIVVSDDASTDDTISTVLRVADSLPQGVQVRLISSERAGGVVPNFERAIRACRGEVIALCDHDDVWDANRLADALDALPKEQAALVFSNARLIDAAGHGLGGTLFGSLRLSRMERNAVLRGDAYSVLLRRNIVTGAAVLMTRELADLALPLPPSWLHDEWLAIIASVTGRVVLFDECLLSYRLHATNQIGMPSPKIEARLRRALASRANRYSVLHRKYSDLLERLVALGADEKAIATLRDKVAFESARSRFAVSRWRRVPQVLRVAHRYRRYSSQRSLDLFRDLLQPA